jgi:hypothetical protein
MEKMWKIENVVYLRLIPGGTEEYHENNHSGEVVL